ncbi:MAG: hypothetical protein RL338_835 [Chloroflexota bacterium]|jgi:hypothetical protein
MTRRDPHVVLGVARDASAATVKAAWRRLARAHHPDVAQDDAAAARLATRRMAEINAAYEQLRDGGLDHPGRRSSGIAGSGRRRAPTGPSVRTKAHAPAGVPQQHPGRPVSARVDLSGAFHVAGGRTPRGGTAAVRGGVIPPDWRTGPRPLRASAPNGPLRRFRAAGVRVEPPPSLEASRGRVIEFGKFHGHTLGEIAAFEPSYIDWIATTITRDPELVAAARVVRADLDARGVRRIRRAERVGPRPPEPLD